MAVLTDPTQSTWGTLTLRNVQTVGQVLLEARDSIRSGHVVIDGVTVVSADVRGRADRPHGFGVDALQGAFTLWNRQADSSVELTAELKRIAAGTKAKPVRGSGVFVAGTATGTARPMAEPSASAPSPPGRFTPMAV